ncbi:3-keto-5-aminohexanoate cleavage protein [Burkholderia stagnalis]|uniref:3-keto-5-aminohexanoate cleavage protein n=1 Tax=Burkholderia stagnalis TaxID=1503054 RepID=UPI00075ECD6C|nr:3-keto-5-aminohexanoate cleavage protein [Burkholderia stagnalis]KWI24591.1 hypothetical protein WT71_25250 [Burkholderia stagnalis]KWI81148.1 hypothetical protein WT73_27890 [Burkholderia stagnalis]MDY7806667.1 3-keto-5-aminohexanoate cleavage protein [Burkholderia stagnalis]
MKSMYITAAPTGAVPKWLNPLEPTFVPSYLLHRLLDSSTCGQVIAQLQSDGWDAVLPGGLLIQSGHDSPISDDWLARLRDASTAREALREAGWCHRDQAWHPPDRAASDMAVLSREWLSEIKSIDLARQLVLQFTAYGWTATENGDLIWGYSKLHSYLPPALIDSIRIDCPTLLEKLETAGWQTCPAGYWQSGKARSPFLPITPEAIVAESIRSVQEGAAVVHLHTRELADRTQVQIPGLGAISVGTQRNQIMLDHYDAIVPAMRAADANAILNLSTSVRGDRHGARSGLRRAHLKRYGDAEAPEVASLSPAAVVFQGGGGYDNAPDFLAAQFEHFQRLRTRPEVEVFNHAIVDNATTLYRERLETVGTPVLFMLVAGVDQYRRDPISGELEDDSLISSPVRKEITRLLMAGDAVSKQRAIEIAAAQLDPVVKRLRDSFPVSKISMLLPGPLQVMLAELALRLRLDGVRVGLEDGLNVFDSRVPGGVRKARGTWEQVRMLREELIAKGVNVQTTTQVRNMLGMPLASARYLTKKYA